MNLVKQPDDSGLCMAACCAMIVGCTLEEVLANVKLTAGQLPNGEPIYHLTACEANRFLASRNYTYGMIVDTWSLNGNIIVDGLKSVNAILAVEDEYPEYAHAVVWDAEEQFIRDPMEDEPQDLDDYRVYEWIPCTRLVEDE